MLIHSYSLVMVLAVPFGRQKRVYSQRLSRVNPLATGNQGKSGKHARIAVLHALNVFSRHPRKRQNGDCRAFAEE